MQKISDRTGQFFGGRRVTDVQSSVHGVATTPQHLHAPAVRRATFIDFDDFYRAEFASMVALAQSICGDRAAGEDVAQEAMAKAHQHWGRIANYERPGGWLRRVTINVAISRRRRLRRELSTLRRRALERRPEEVHDPGRDDELWDAVQRLPPRQRSVVALFYQQGHSTREIASILDCSVSTATSHLSEARKRLALELGESLDVDDQPAGGGER